MYDPTLSTFLAILAIVIALILWWRVMIILVAALVIAILVMGVHAVLDRVEPRSAQETIDVR
ncbi:MAG TPA: hypothetical protein VFQ77_06315 [Pseudonocardiaceae bacterium]|jgi:fatty acid desaturase|nr:hypothetical protein [Pseudonocardiaceae bacterium]